MRRPSFLKPGDTIAIAATARKVSVAEIQPAMDLFSSWGLRVKFSTTLFESENQFAGSDAQRALGLQQLLDDPGVHAIICARGGYGTVRLIDQLNFTSFEKEPKWIIGFSDITVLHSHINTHHGIETLHAPMAFNAMPERYDETSMMGLRNVLFGKLPEYNGPPHAANKTGSGKGKLTGGNLSVLYSLIGSASDINTEGKILFLEDLDEYLYHIDRMMMNMKRTGKLEKLAGLVVGGMDDMKDNAIPFGSQAEQIIRAHTEAYDFPVCFGFPAGHGRLNLPLIMGAEANLHVKENGSALVIH